MREVATIARTLETANAAVKNAQKLALQQFERGRTDLGRTSGRRVEAFLQD